MADLSVTQGRAVAVSGVAVSGVAASDLVLAVHGSADPASTRVSEALRDAVAARLPGVRVHLGWADVLTPTLSETLAGLRTGWEPGPFAESVDERGPCVVVPVFLTGGYHVTVDVPRAMADSGVRATLTPRVGDLLAAVVDRLAEAGGPGDAVVLAGAGSRRPESVAEVRAAARALSARSGRPVEAAFVTSASPGVAEAVAGFAARGLRPSIASYLLAPGSFHARLRGLAEVVSEPIGAHPVLVEAIITRYRSAEAPPSRTKDLT